MKNLYSVRIAPAPAGCGALPVLACTENAAIRKALKAAFGAVSAAPAEITAAAEMIVSGVIV